MAVMFNAVVHIPVILVGMQATSMVGEGVRRVFAFCINGLMGSDPQASTSRLDSKSLRQRVFNLCCPHNQMKNEDLVAGAVGGIILASVGWELCSLTLGPVPPHYNLVNRWISPVLLDPNWRHPVIKKLASYFAK